MMRRRLVPLIVLLSSACTGAQQSSSSSTDSSSLTSSSSAASSGSGGTLGSSSSSGPSASSGSGGTLGSSSASSASTASSGSSSGSTGANCNATLGSGTVVGFAHYPGVRAAVLVPVTFFDGGVDASQLELVLSANYYPPPCVPAIGPPNTDRFTLRVAAPGDVAAGTYASPLTLNSGASVEWYLGGPTTGGGFGASDATITLDSVSSTEASGSFECDIWDQSQPLLPDGGEPTVHVTGTFDAVLAPDGAAY
ncbi:MAG: hypothetical protein JST54_12160 [Deltaproteobacteria bacterium]|nr:hypothetical protein [Deltaproteobacteria bacterium]